MEYFGRAQSAVEKNKYAEAEEKVNLAVLGSYGADGEIDNKLLKENINKIDGIYDFVGDDDISSDFFEIIVDGYAFKIQKNGKVEGDKELATPEELPENEKNTEAGTRVQLEKEWEGTTQANTAVYAVSDGEGNTIPIPKGFYYVGGTLETGVVISDSLTDKNKEKDSSNEDIIASLVGNQFVWIPCKYNKESDEADNNVVYYNGSTDNTDTREDNWKEKSKQNYYNGGTWYDYQPHHEGKTSVEKYGGFYVARYEAGVPSNAPFYASKQGDVYYTDEKTGENTSKTKDTDKYTPVSKKGQQAWSYISQTNAKKVAEKMVDNKNVKSYLIDSHAWNTVCKIIEKKDESKNLLDSSDWGNYYDNTSTNYENINGLWALHKLNGSTWSISNYSYGVISSNVPPRGEGTNRLELATGSSEDFKAYNIYDMAGNMWEWTTETGNNNKANDGTPTCNEEECPSESKIHAVLRGSCCQDKGKVFPIVAAHAGNGLDHTSAFIGFRAVLYMK